MDSTRINPKTDDSGYRIEDFLLQKTIGTGTFAKVSLCQHRLSDEFYALKILSIHDIIRLKQIEHIKNEKSILSEINHPFIVDLLWSYKDKQNLFLLFPFVSGGELFAYLRSSGRFNVPTTQFFTAEIVSALDYLHSRSIVYRDLKPENILLDERGHLKLVDFGFAKRLSHRTYTLCGTPEYLAPEIIQSKGHGKAVDWWAFGIIIYEMLAGYPPFFDDNPFGIYEKILSGKIDWPRQIDPIAKDIIKKLLVQDLTKRLGSMKNGADDIKKHRWFKNISDWDDVPNRKLKPPILPILLYKGDSHNFDTYKERDEKSVPVISDDELKYFDDF